MANRSGIEEFLSSRRVAFVGVSTDERDFSRTVWSAFRTAGYDMVPINPQTLQIEGIRAYARLADVDEPVDAVFVMVGARDAYSIVRDCVVAEVPRVWLHKGVEQNSATPEAVQLAQGAGMVLVAGECPTMFLGGHPAFAQYERTGVAS